MIVRACYEGTAPETFPGAGWYPPSISAAASISTVPTTVEDDQAAEAQREARGPFGFARALAQSADPLRWEGDDG